VTEGDVTDPYLDDVHRWWHLSVPSPELVAAKASGWLGESGAALDIGCGLGTEIGHLAANGWNTVGIDLSPAALGQARSTHRDAPFIQADALRLPFADASFHLALDRGCFHYLHPGEWAGYAAEARRVLRPGGRLLLRACLTSRGVRNAITEAGVRETFAGWTIDQLAHGELPSDTRTMRALTVRLRRD
jgi:SAM-dependent methyltransferase